MKTNFKRAVIGAVAVGAIFATSAVASAHESPPTRTTSPVAAFAAPDDPVGTSTVKRGDDSIHMNMRAEGMAPRDTFTVWWVVFNNPDACSPPGCGSDDIFVDGDSANPLDDEQIAAADIVAAYATGKVTSPAGKVNMSATVRANESAGTREIIFGQGATVKDTRNAEVHLVARSHGPAVPGMVHEQIGSFAGGCDVFLDPPEIADDPGECVDLLFAVHQP